MLGAAAHTRGSGLRFFLPIAVLVVALFAESGVSGKHFEKRDTKAHDWNYESDKGPLQWKTMFKSYCAGGRQSPINIDTKEVDLNEDLEGIDFDDNYDEPMKDAYIQNNGHTIKVAPGASDPERTFTEGGFDDTYEFEELHFHWGADSKKGSEHTINGKQYPLEMHLVHRNTNYKDLNAAKMREDGIAVLSVLFKVDDEDNEALEPIIDKLDDVRVEGTTKDLDDIDLSDLLPDDLMPFYRYEGSLTTPPCNEVVTWIIFKEFATISEKQLEQFRNVIESEKGESDEPLVDNFRPVQPLHGRVVEMSGEEESGAGTTTISFTTLLFAVLLSIRLTLFH